MINIREIQSQWNQHQVSKFKNCMDHPKKRAWKQNLKSAFNQPPANVREVDDKYELFLFAPGYEKKDFQIDVVERTLSVSVEDKVEPQGNWKRKEYSTGGFNRQFELNEKVDLSSIAAKYKNGVLIISLPKLEGLETARQEIVIS